MAASRKVQLTDGDLALVLEALDDAAYFREARSRVVKAAVKRRMQRFGSARVGTEGAPSGAVDRDKAKAFQALAIKLRAAGISVTREAAGGDSGIG
jgi:hypothetical protein